MRAVLTGAPAIIGPVAVQPVLGAAERLILDEGWAAVTEPRVAEIAGLPSHFVRRYFKCADDLLAAVFRRRAE